MKKLLLATAAVMAIASAPAFAGDHSHGDKDYGHSHKEMKAEKNIVEIATSKDDFSTLATALTEAGLVETVQDAESLTVFAPTNDAFAKLPEGTLDTLLLPENKEQLTSILTYHVVPSKIMAGDIAMGTTEVETLQGDTLTVTKTEDGVMVDGANVTMADVKASNGVIHVIDTVVMPAAE
jgi:uncharacterized surface protein with fasciclin (FAS1) repeats